METTNSKLQPASATPEQGVAVAEPTHPLGKFVTLPAVDAAVIERIWDDPEDPQAAVQAAFALRAG